MENKNTNNIDYAALKKALTAGGVVIIGGIVYYVTAWKVKKDIIEPALKSCMEEADKFLTSWATKNKETK